LAELITPSVGTLEVDDYLLKIDENLEVLNLDYEKLNMVATRIPGNYVVLREGPCIVCIVDCHEL
jgi:hypothetical protein